MSDAMAPLKIVMVEDVESDAEITLRELKRGGLRVEFRRVETEMELVRECDEFDPDVVLSDFALPNFDGLSALSVVRQLKPDVPFIFVSGTIGEETAVKSLRSGATDYVLKTNLSRLAAAVQRAVQETVRATSSEGDKRVGVVWHTQGSGKSLTMAFYAGRVILAPEMENPTIVVLTDDSNLSTAPTGFPSCSAGR